MITQINTIGGIGNPKVFPERLEKFDKIETASGKKHYIEYTET